MSRGLTGLLAAAAVCFCGCVSVDCGYTQNEPVRVCCPAEKIPVTYSVDYRYFTFEPGAPETCETLRQMIADGLAKSGRYSEIAYSEEPLPGRRHLVFAFRSWETHPGIRLMLLAISGLNYLIPPVYADHSLDGTVSVYENGRRIHAAGTAEVVQTTLWLPLVVFDTSYPVSAAEAEQREGVVNALVNAASEADGGK